MGQRKLAWAYGMLPPEFWHKVVQEGECWVWTGALAQKYGSFRTPEGTRSAHRLAWEERYGPVPPGLQLDHECLNKRCVRPDHLEVVTNLVNSRRASRLLDEAQAALIRELYGVSRLVPSQGSVLFLRPTQEELAAQFGVSQSLVSEIVRGEAYT